ncbi:DUF1192 domain-containing protein [Methylobacterium nodulans]|uniref:DUF1192 domain-containing protein n=1 Tax=Methylobacterium nodulans (strain LMG 21967 / CNCM I-2342 / ORS 2060) TaxID=460265 RepID=B8IMM6_METNO|nr:DUF1192 domain-containing protein [Methylobacterium nodulans]ACL60219.1 protein of unknown function DUF1192 [Methylobacterium nodulans ORS 2060]
MLTDDDRPRPAPAAHVIGQDLTALSIADLDARIALLRREIERLEEARRHREASQEAARAVFKL